MAKAALPETKTAQAIEIKRGVSMMMMRLSPHGSEEHARGAALLRLNVHEALARAMARLPVDLEREANREAEADDLGRRLLDGLVERRLVLDGVEAVAEHLADGDPEDELEVEVDCVRKRTVGRRDPQTGRDAGDAPSGTTAADPTTAESSKMSTPT